MQCASAGFLQSINRILKFAICTKSIFINFISTLLLAHVFGSYLYAVTTTL